MANYYLDIETTGTDEVMDKIITIQYAELEQGTGKQVGDLKILKEWDSGEEEMIRQFIIDSPVVNPYSFDFVPVGYNLAFEHKFLLEKTSKYTKLFPITILTRPHIDLHNLGILLNGGKFKNSGLDKFTDKPSNGSQVPVWYRNKEYEKIENYIRQETKEFIKFYRWAHRELPLLESNLKQAMRAP